MITNFLVSLKDQLVLTLKSMIKSLFLPVKMQRISRNRYLISFNRYFYPPLTEIFICNRPSSFSRFEVTTGRLEIISDYRGLRICDTPQCFVLQSRFWREFLQCLTTLVSMPGPKNNAIGIEH